MQKIFASCVCFIAPHFSLYAASPASSSQNPFTVFDGHAYEIITTAMSWTDAEAYASANGGRLLVINSFQENFFIERLMMDHGRIAPDGGGARYHWLGASDSLVENDWIWVDGSTLETTQLGGRAFWGNGPVDREPDNFNNQDCLAMAVSAWPAVNPGFYGSAGQWNDIDCDNKLNFIIEYNIFELF